MDRDWKNVEQLQFSAKSARDEEDLAQHDLGVKKRYIKGHYRFYCWTNEGNLYKKIEGEWVRNLIGAQTIEPYEIGSWLA